MECAIKAVIDGAATKEAQLAPPSTKTIQIKGGLLSLGSERHSSFNRLVGGKQPLKPTRSASSQRKR
jgi:hypothetical protein